MIDARVKKIIEALAQPEPLPDLSALCPDKKELMRILLEILEGPKSPYSDDLRETAELQHLDVRDLTQKARFLLASMSIASSTDYYSVLEVDQCASTEEIRERWAEKIKMYHPDKYEDPTGWIAQQARTLNEAYAVLKDPEKRREYDAARRARMRGGIRTQVTKNSVYPGRRADSSLVDIFESKLPLLVAVAATAIAGWIIVALLWPW